MRNKILTSIVSIGMLDLASCERSLEEPNQIEQKQEIRYDFYKFGCVDKEINLEIKNSPTMQLGDIDGDNDLDIILFYKNSSWDKGILEIYENKIPQKNK